MRKLLAIGATALGLIGLSAGLLRPVPATARLEGPDPRAPQRPLTADALAVRLLLGVGDPEPRSWSGTVALDEGAVLGIEGWRLRAEGRVTGPDSWTAASLVLRKAVSAKQAAKKPGGAGKKQQDAPALIGPTGVVVQLKAPPTATLTVATAQGTTRIPLAELRSGAPRRYLTDRIEARLVPTHAPLVAGEGQEDFPAAVSDGKNGAWVVYVEHRPRGPEITKNLKNEPDDFKSYVPTDGGDQVRLVHFDGASADTPRDVTGPGRDVGRPAVAVAGPKVVVVWPEQINGNWDLYSRAYDTDRQAWDEPTRLTTHPGADADPVLTATDAGRVHLAWQAWRDGQADIFLAPVHHPAEAVNVSNHPANDWSPAIALDAAGAPIVAYDTYRNGSYDVLVYDSASGRGGRTMAVADSPRFEARPSIAVDRSRRIWVAYEERAVHWGKDFGVHDTDPGAPLYRESAVRVRCLDGEKVLDTGDPVAAAPPDERPMTSFPRLALDRSGRPWLLYRHRQENLWRDSPVAVVGAVWYEYATTRAGRSWSPPRPLPRSDNLLDNRPALAATAGGPVLAFYATDGRLHGEGAATGTPRAVNNDLMVAALTAPADAAAPEPGSPVEPAAAVPALHANEAADVARLRSYRIEHAGKTYQLLRGEFHRHTEISSDGGGDGALEDMWRYALDAARLDWVGCGDHDNGNGREYTWWLTQKTTDLYHNPPAFVPMFTYERSVLYPGGHRNVMFPYRGVRTLPRLVGDGGVQTDVNGRDLDAQMLYRYLRELNGICAAHTSGTDMGTDWRANDPRVEPIVEIYQGIRDSYEHLGAPRAARSPADAVGGWRPLGMVWNALALQYRIGFQSSSDHVSTHISFAVAIAEEPTREAIFDAFQKRHCYAATDNILLDVRCGDYLMGDEFTLDDPVTLAVRVHGTAPLRRVDIIKDFHYVYSTEPRSERTEFRWTDAAATNLDPSWYYVRVLQEDGEIAWGSPLWIHRSAR